MDKKTMVRNFSRSARFYDDYADAQRLAALKLLSQLGLYRFQNILEIGCGTGSYSYLLRKKFDQAQLKSVDISEKMIEVAREKLRREKIEFIVGDAERIDLGSGFDLITSNACFQWFENVQRAVIRYREMLKKDGQISFSIMPFLSVQEYRYGETNLTFSIIIPNSSCNLRFAASSTDSSGAG